MCQYEELVCLSIGQGLLESPCECGIEPPSFISHRVSELVSYNFEHKASSNVYYTKRPLKFRSSNVSFSFQCRFHETHRDHIAIQQLLLFYWFYKAGKIPGFSLFYKQDNLPQYFKFDNTRTSFCRGPGSTCLHKHRSNECHIVLYCIEEVVIVAQLRPFQDLLCSREFRYYQEVNMPIKFCSEAYFFQA